MDRLDELEKALREYKAMLEDSVNMKKTAREEMIEELEKFFGLGGTSTSGQEGGTSQGTAGTGGTGDIKSNLGSLLGKKEEKEDKKKKKKMDPVGQEDEDVDNDGDVDSSDKYLKARREKISEAMGKKEHSDEKEDKKMIAEALDRHNEKKHGEPKDEDSAKKDMEKADGKEADRVKFKVNPEQGAKKVGVERSKTGAGPVKDVTDKVSAEEKSKYEQAINKSEAQELIKYNELGQWTLSKAEDSKKKLK